MQSLKNKVALITGGAQGIGLACAAALGNAGARVVIADVDQPAMQAAVDKLESTGVQARSVACDVSNREQVDAAVVAAVESFGGLDVLVANAGACRALLRTTWARGHRKAQASCVQLIS